MIYIIVDNILCFNVEKGCVNLISYLLDYVDNKMYDVRVCLL